MVDNQYKIQDTTATKKIFSLKKRIRAVKGGTSASKTISILIWIIDYAQSIDNEIVSVVSESYPHLSGGAIRDFKTIMSDRGYWNDHRWNETKHTYTFETGTIVEFLAVDSYGKAHGPRRDVLFLNECNNLSWLIVDQLITRTRKVVWMDWNPVEEFWFNTELLGKRDDIDYITLTYLDNEALDPITIREIESHRHNKNWWKVYALGEVGDLETRIYKNWQIIDEIPHEARLERTGLDFGYTNDPTAIVDIYKYNGGYILDQVAYAKGMSNKDIADILNAKTKKALVKADPAEPKSIDEIALYQVNIMGAEKGQGSVLAGIQFVQSQPISVTKRSVHLIKEYRNYTWTTDKDGTIINEPMDINNHAMDAIRYGFSDLIEVARNERRDRHDRNMARRRNTKNHAR